MKDKSDDLVTRCPVCLNLFPANIIQMQDGFMACALCGAKYSSELANQGGKKDDTHKSDPQKK